jgi:hypothetical protein
MSEKILEIKITKKAKELGFLTYKFSSPANRGVPDKIFISPNGKIFFIEFKSTKGKLSELQKHEIHNLQNHLINTHVVRDFEDGLTILDYYV